MSIFIISEIGINHNGDLNLAKKMILASKNIGVDAVKFQKRDINLVYSKDQLNEKRESPWGTLTIDQKKGLELSQDDYIEIDKYCKKIGIKWFASAWDLNSLAFLKKFNLEYNKIASAMIVDRLFLEEVAKEKKYTFISTGMSNMEHINHAVTIFKKHNCSFELMHCISAYPFDDSMANLNMINHLKNTFNCKVGYSGHEKGGQAISIAAATLGASSIERHFTLDRTMYGSDQAASLEIKGFKDLVESIRKVEKALQGSLDKKILDIEKNIANKLRMHIKI
jgi:N-acetylneuraminate synthase